MRERAPQIYSIKGMQDFNHDTREEYGGFHF